MSDTLFDSTHRYASNNDFSDLVGGNSSITHKIYESTDSLNVTTQSGDLVYRESKKVFPCQPGKALTVIQSFVFSSAKNGLRQRVGYFSRQNGFYLQLNDSTLSIVSRTSTSGSPIETLVNQDQWNVDTFDGTGPSRITLDINKSQILFTEYEWLGVGSVKVGFAIDGQFHTAHQFNHANYLDKVYMTASNLPVRYEIQNINTTSSPSALKQICVTVLSSGGYKRSTELRSAARPELISNFGTTFVPISAIKMSEQRTDSVVRLARASGIVTTSNNVEIVVFRNPTLTGGTWITHRSTGNVQYNTSATGISGGSVVRQMFIAGSNQSNVQADIVIEDGLDMQLGRTNTDPQVSDVFALAIRTLSGTADGTGALHWYDH